MRNTDYGSDYVNMNFIPANINKTILYYKRNGLKDTIYALMERIEEKKKNKYSYIEPNQYTLNIQREDKFSFTPLISVVIPCYETKPVYLEDLILSIEDQTYTNYEIVICDASESTIVHKVVNELNALYSNINYIKLDENKGISDNTNVGIEAAKGDYIALLDHDDVLTPDALYYVAKAIEKNKQNNIDPLLIYTDEDKTDMYLDTFYEPNLKEKINLDLIVTNNYVCHLSVYESALIKKLKLRKEYDGAQDFDLVLRTLLYSIKEYENDWKEHIIHVSRVLYHWRCHENSTAANPASKDYAYENGRLAVMDFVKSMGWKCEVSHMKHRGFYRTEFKNGILNERDDIAVIGGPVYNHKVIIGGAMNAKGNVKYKGLKIGYSGYLHRASLTQDVEALDIRNIKIKKQYVPIFEKETGLKYPVVKSQINNLSEDEIISKSVRFCNKIRKNGKLLCYDPQLKSDINNLLRNGD